MPTTQELITALTNSRNKIRDKAVELGISNSTAKLDELATAVDGITNNGAVDATVKEGESYTVPKGYHNGAGVVKGVGGGGSYNLQAKTVTPTKSQQSVTPDTGYYGLSGVTVNPIPNNYADVSSTTATAADVTASKIFIAADGTTTAGTMPDNGAVNKTLDATANNQSYTVPAGRHSGTGKVKIELEEKSATPTEAPQTVTPATGKVLSKVTVNAIPKIYGNATDADATAANILAGKSAIIKVNNAATMVEGTMPNNGAINGSFDGLTATSYTVPAGYTSGGNVSLTNAINEALAAI